MSASIPRACPEALATLGSNRRLDTESAPQTGTTVRCVSTETGTAKRCISTGNSFQYRTRFTNLVGLVPYAASVPDTADCKGGVRSTELYDPRLVGAYPRSVPAGRTIEGAVLAP
eukprot:2253076-Rhodomonas_salina.5